jgi:hypothetical protein
VEVDDGAHVTWASDRNVGLGSRSLEITAVRVETANFIPVGEGDIGIAAQAAILVGQSV